jgi:hypothetical protein
MGSDKGQRIKEKTEYRSQESGEKPEARGRRSEVRRKAEG